MTNRADGLLVTIDGPGGVGKTTTIGHLAAILTHAGLPVHRTAQPSTGPIGALVRDLVPTAGGAALACLFAADRYHQLDTEIRPHAMTARSCSATGTSPRAWWFNAPTAWTSRSSQPS